MCSAFIHWPSSLIVHMLVFLVYFEWIISIGFSACEIRKWNENLNLIAFSFKWILTTHFWSIADQIIIMGNIRLSMIKGRKQFKIIQNKMKTFQANLEIRNTRWNSLPPVECNGFFSLFNGYRECRFWMGCTNNTRNLTF